MYCFSQCQIGILTDTFKILWNIYDRGFLQKLWKISQQSTYSNPQSLYFEKCNIGILKILESVFLEQNIWFLATFSNLSVVLVRLSVAPHPLSTRCILHYMSAGSHSDVVSNQDWGQISEQFLTIILTNSIQNKSTNYLSQ